MGRLCIACLLALSLGACKGGDLLSSSRTTGNTGTAVQENTKRDRVADESRYNLGAPQLPDNKLTPGDALDVTREDICVPGYARKVRDVPQALKEKVYAQYAIQSRQPAEYEVDHLISLELGGSNSIRNLWPESYKTRPWNAYSKDKLENKLHDMVCKGEIDLETAQQDIATDWISAYKKYVDGTSQSGELEASPPTDDEGGPVLGNRRSHVYHRPGCPDYNRVSKANRIEFANAAEAERAGYRVAGNCD